MSSRKRTILEFCVALIIFVGLGYAFRTEVAPWVASVGDKVASELPQLEKRVAESVSESIEHVKERVVMIPPPIRREREAPGAELTVAGTIGKTNDERRAHGLAALTENAELAAAARAKANDLFARQYFEHESPSGEGPADLAKAAGYDFIAIGENLALGNFDDDADLITAWMNSPGHRANILHGSFTEIGVAVVEGTYEGRTTWMAVQEFGRPRAACPPPSEHDRLRIEANEQKLDNLQLELNDAEQELTRARESGDNEAYNREAEAYNELVREHNDLVDETKLLVASFNKAVKAYNACVGE